MQTGMALVQIELTGTSPLVVHNIRLADPDDDIVKQIKTFTSKRTKTEEDRREVERLEWFGGLYLEDGVDGPAMPTRSLRKCFIRGAVITKRGTQLQRALSFTDLAVPILYDGPRSVEDLWERREFRYRDLVNVSGSRTVRMRPKFPGWQIVARAFLLDSVMDLSDLQRVITDAGLSEGLSEARTLGFGRFEGTVKEL
jgi:hypothetical protein